MIIRAQAYPRAALIGNPSDGYHGKTIAFTFRNFAAQVILYETPELEILPSARDHSVFESLAHLAQDVESFGYYGGIRLLKAAVKTFYDHCRARAIVLHKRNFTLRYHSNIPHLVGLAGSSAIITACMRALMRFYRVEITHPELANLVLEVETRQLDIAAGLQDRVAQVYQGLVFMDFDAALMHETGYGRYVPLEAARLPPLYIAYRTDLAEGSEIVHNAIRDRYHRGEPAVVEAMRQWAAMTDAARHCLENGDRNGLARLMNQNFDLRAELYAISAGNLRMIEAARSAGASAKFTGSGGAIIGTLPDTKTYRRLIVALSAMRVRVFRPIPV